MSFLQRTETVKMSLNAGTKGALFIEQSSDTMETYHDGPQLSYMFGELSVDWGKIRTHC